MRRSGAIWAAAFAVCVMGCRPDDPGTLCAVDLEATLADVLILDSGSTVRIEVALFAVTEDGDGDSMEDVVPRELCSRDSLRVNERAAFLRPGPMGQPSYVVNLDRGVPDYTLVYTRDGVATTFVMNVNVPAFEVTAPIAGQEVSRTEPLAVTWEPAEPSREEAVVIILDDEIDGIECLQAFEPFLAPDNGEAVIPAEKVQVFDGVDENFACDAQLTVARLEETQIVPRGAGSVGFHSDSSVVALTLRNVGLVSTGAPMPDTGP
ncbi:MAG: hypothetical protein ACPG4T_15330 [Nannocystaceae bacterium]